MVCLGNEQRSFCHFWDCTKYRILDSYVDYEGYSNSSKGLLPTVVDIIVISVKLKWTVYRSSIQSFLVHWFLKCWCSLLPSPVWPLSICLDSWTYHFRFLCNIALYSIRLYFHHRSHAQLGDVFALALSLHSFCVYFSWEDRVNHLVWYLCGTLSGLCHLLGNSGNCRS